MRFLCVYCNEDGNVKHVHSLDTDKETAEKRVAEYNSKSEVKVRLYEDEILANVGDYAKSMFDRLNNQTEEKVKDLIEKIQSSLDEIQWELDHYEV